MRRRLSQEIFKEEESKGPVYLRGAGVQLTHRFLALTAGYVGDHLHRTTDLLRKHVGLKSKRPGFQSWHYHEFSLMFQNLIIQGFQRNLFYLKHFKKFLN